MIRFIGVYDYTVLLTYISLFCSIFGITKAVGGDFNTAVFCLAMSGLCDAFDGRVARSKKNRTEDERSFGIQLDSLCDVICFGLFPGIICYYRGVNGPLGLFLIFFFCTCGLIRLAFFNVLEAKRQQEEGQGSGNKTYRGLPITSVAFIFPLVYWIGNVFLPEQVFLVLLHVMLAVVGALFILDFRLRKPKFKTLMIMVGATAITVGAIYAYSKLRHNDVMDEDDAAVETIEGINDSSYETENS